MNLCCFDNFSCFFIFAWIFCFVEILFGSLHTHTHTHKMQFSIEISLIGYNLYLGYLQCFKSHESWQWCCLMTNAINRVVNISSGVNVHWKWQFYFYHRTENSIKYEIKKSQWEWCCSLHKNMIIPMELSHRAILNYIMNCIQQQRF